MNFSDYRKKILIPISSSLIQYNGQSKQAGETPLPWPLKLEFVLRKCKHMEYTEFMQTVVFLFLLDYRQWSSGLCAFGTISIQMILPAGSTPNKSQSVDYLPMQLTNMKYLCITSIPQQSHSCVLSSWKHGFQGRITQFRMHSQIYNFWPVSWCIKS